MNLKKAFKKTKAAQGDQETTGPKSNKEFWRNPVSKSLVECLEDVEESETR